MISEKLTGKDVEVSVTEFMVLSWHFPGRTKKKREKNHGIWSSGQYLKPKFSKFETGVDPTNHQ
jgi:hypothetical protein